MRILRAGLFTRVSTEEQARFGYSIAAQKEALEEYCREHKMKVADHFCDNGVSGGISYKKRPEMMRLLKDIADGNVDIIIFTRLDRWFRNIGEYMKVQEILDYHKVAWKAIWEDYDTQTANGRMAITIFLAIAQNEREKTSERISAVFANKRKNKESFFGKNSIPFGYTEEKDENGITRLVKDPELKDALQVFFDTAIKYDNVSKAAKIVTLEYGLTRNKSKWMELVKKEIYSGTHRGVEDYCPAYVSRENWDKLQIRNFIKPTKRGRVYLFTGLLRCPVCGNSMAANYCKQKLDNGEIKEYYSYRCQKKDIGLCKNRHTISQIKAERWLVNNIEELIKNEIAQVEIEMRKPKPKPKTNIAALKEKLRRLDVVYMAGNKSDDDYLKEQNELKAAIKKAEQEEPLSPADRDMTNMKEILETNFKSIYKTLDEEDKRALWRTVIKQIHINGNDIVSVDFN